MKWYYNTETHYGQTTYKYFKRMADHVRFADGGYLTEYNPQQPIVEITDPETIKILEQELQDNTKKNNDIYERHYKDQRYSGD